MPVPNQLRTLVAGDVGQSSALTLTGVADLTGCTAVAKVWRDGVSPVTLSAAVTNGPTAEVTVQWGTWLQSTATRGAWLFEVEVTDGSGDVTTWPRDEPARLTVRDDA